MARTVRVFRDNALQKAALEAERVEADVRYRAEHRRSVLDMAQAISSATLFAVEQVRERTAGLTEAATRMGSLTEAAGGNAANVAAASEQTLQVTQAVAAAAEQLAVASEEIRRQVGEAAEIALAAVGASASTTETIDGLVTAADGVGGIVNLIEQIAERRHPVRPRGEGGRRGGDSGRWRRHHEA
jgi:methyl-accepting chemotaxis protein